MPQLEKGIKGEKMNRENHSYDMIDAFLALRDIDDDAIEGMLRENKKARDAHIHEGKAYSVSAGSKDLEAARKFIDEDAEDGDQIEVIDVDADSVDHLKKNTEYVGQGILSCTRCKANRFIDMDLLVPSESDEDVYNTDDECPHCHDAGSGYTLLGQVGKVQKSAAEESPVEADPEAAVTNDEINPDEATFDNDLEDEVVEEPQAEEEAEEEIPDVETFEEEPEADGMETDTSEEELDDLDLPSLGDEIDSDDTEEDEDNDVKESLNEEVELNAMAEEAWMMNRVISCMNNEDAYYGSWLYLWPDGETREACAYDFGDHESFDELKDKFIRTYKHYHADGLYDAPADVVEYAHMMDSRLGLSKIENLAPIKPHVRESFDCSVAADIFNAITSPENVDKIVIFNLSDDDSEPKTLYTGSKEDLPMNIVGSPCRSFDVADGYLSCNIDADVENTNRPLRKALECFSDDKTDKVLIWDQAAGEEVFAGTKDEACKKFGHCEFISFETPAVIRITIDNPGIIACDELEDEKVETDVDKLVKKIIDANNLSQYKTDKPNTNEYWIRTCLEENDDVELIYESFVKPTENKALIKEFKAVTGYNNALEAAYEAGFAAAANVTITESMPSEDDMLSEAFMSRKRMIDELQYLGKEHWNFDRFTDAQLFRMLEKERAKNAPAAKVEREPDLLSGTCENCGAKLNDGGTCPSCDDGEEQLESVAAPVSLDTVEDEVAAIEAPEVESDIKNKKEVVTSFKSRKELAEAVNDCKNNSRPYTIKRSTTEGYRYDLITEAIDDEEVTSLVPASGGEIEIVDDIPQQMPVEYSPQQRELMNQLQRIAVDTAEAIARYYNIDADPQIIVADIIRDLQLISGDISVDDLGDSAADRATRDLFNSYQDFYAFVDELVSAETGVPFVTTPEEKIRQAVSMLHGPSFSTANIYKAIGSTAFLQAARSGNVPYIASSDIPLLEEAFKHPTSDEADVCEGCGKAPCECSQETADEELDETLDVDIDSFDAQMNEYFNESYEDTVLYTTTGGSVSTDGTIMLEGTIQYEEVMKPIHFTLTPDHKISEDVEDRNAAFDAALKENFTVTNDISEEVFEFNFKG